jgi:hypothetical protein
VISSSRLTTLLAGGLCLAASLMMLPNDASAARFFNPNTCAPGRNWATNGTVAVRLHLPSMEAVFSPAERVAIAADIQYVIDQVNGVSGSELELDFGVGLTSPTDFDPKVDIFVNTIVIGFVDKPNRAPAWMDGGTSQPCDFTHNNIAFNTDKGWRFGTPEDQGRANPWMNGRTFKGDFMFRAILLHEMGHAIGLHHPNNKYAVMDHGEKSWTNGSGDVEMRYLPDDRVGLRTLYPGPGQEAVDVTVTDTWFGHANLADPAAQQMHNCKPSRFSGNWVDEEDDTMPFCAPNLLEPNVVCPGEFIQVRYTLNNNHDGLRDAEEHIWFSTDGEWDFFDRLSPTTRYSTIPGESSDLRTRKFLVPEDIAPGAYWPIAQVHHDYANWDVDFDNNFIALNGMILVEDFPECEWHSGIAPIPGPSPEPGPGFPGPGIDPPGTLDPLDP